VSDAPDPAHSVGAGDLAGRRVTVAGLGRFGGGVGLTRWLCSRGARVTVSDIADAEALADSVEALEGCDAALHLGGHDKADFFGADLLVVNPAIPKDSPLLTSAKAAGVLWTTEINLFLQRCPAKVVGITGTVGKSTTTAMAGKILADKYTTHVGGNIGKSLLESLDEIREDHVVVLELSSFQLEDVPLIGVSPHVAVVTNLQPNHLDRHKTLAAYASAKKNIYRFQGGDDVLILNASDPATTGWAREAPGKVEWFRPSDEPFELSVPGEHNQANAQAAWAAGRLLGVDREAAAGALRDFAPLPHRLQFVTERDGVRYYNDSKCTTPEGAVVALDAFKGRSVVLLAGGYDKHVGFEKLGAAVADRAKALVAFGATRDKIIEAVEQFQHGHRPAVQRADDLPEALALARNHAASGDVILLSPACASYDQFTNYEHRGELFVELVSK